MASLIARYTHWLHTQWPAGTVERLPELLEGGLTALPGVRIVGDLTGVPLLKFSSDSGARAVQAILSEPGFSGQADPGLLDLAIVGAGVSGMAAAIEAKKAGLRFAIFEATAPFATIENFPRGKPIYTYPVAMTPAGQLQFSSTVHPKEELLQRLVAQQTAAGIEVTVARIDRVTRSGSALQLCAGETIVSRARRVIVAIGRSGNHRSLGLPQQPEDKVFNRLHDAGKFAGQQALVVGGGDSAVEAAVALAAAGAQVTLSYRKPQLARPRPENLIKLRMLDQSPTGVRVALGTEVVRIEPTEVTLRDAAGNESSIPNDVVFTMIGREAPLDFFRRSGIPIRGEWTVRSVAAFAAFFAFCVFLYNWKSGGALNQFFRAHQLFPYNLAPWLGTTGKTVRVSLTEPGFYYSFAYCLCVLLFGIQRIRKRKTPYITLQTVTLTLIQWIPLFLLPYLVLPLLGEAGAFDAGLGKTIADHLFPVVSYGHGREYWRAFGLILAWPLFIWNVFTAQPLSGWLAISFVQTFVVIPLIVRRWGKGAYCGWVCSCGALAETMGDAHRQKMPHGPLWNRLNMVGQGILAVALVLFAARAISWTWPQTAVGAGAGRFFHGLLSGWSVLGIELNYYHLVDIFLAGIVGVGCYFWFSGRVWCRFACPLAALMNIYARFSKFRIFAEKEKCISCNVCTSVCHQGIDVMGFANQGLPMEDPQCVRCSACVQSCPTGVLSFGRCAADGQPVLDRLAASPVQMREGATSAENCPVRTG